LVFGMSYLSCLVNRSLVDDVTLCGSAPARKPWVATAIGAALAVGSSWFGGQKASDAAKKVNKMIESEKANDNAWYRRRYNQRFADTAAGQEYRRQAMEVAGKIWKRADGARRVAGATDESAAIAKEAGNKIVGDTIGGMAARDTQRQDAVDAQHRSIQHQLTQQQIGVEQQRAANITNAAQNASNALISAGAAYDAAGAAKTGASQNPSWSISAANSNIENPLVSNSVIGTNSVNDLKRIVGQQ
jgi:hypothetical protein